VSSQYTIIGRIGNEPRLAVSERGVPVLKFSMAVGHRKKKNGEWTEETVWHDVTVFGTTAENAAESLSKGDDIWCQGRLEEPRVYEKKDGTTGVGLSFLADEIGPSLRWQTAIPNRVRREQTSTEVF
jgi:single-strand DNA-binding protein